MRPVPKCLLSPVLTITAACLLVSVRAVAESDGGTVEVDAGAGLPSGGSDAALPAVPDAAWRAADGTIAPDQASKAAPAEHQHEHVHTLVHSHPHPRAEPHLHSHEYGARAHVSSAQRAASSYALSRRELPRGAHVTPADLLRNVPGMFVVQHAGGGKANQYFLRGFDADHGTDLALSLDGVPLNMVSHGHGQGYADLSFVIPELIERVQVSKGPNDPRHGDFATAGAIDLQTASGAPPNRATIEAGSFHSYRGLVLAGSDWQGIRFTGAAELQGTDGPFKRGENLQRGNLFARLQRVTGRGELSLTATGYLSDWRASGQIPAREVRANRLDRFGFVDPHEGGNSTRNSLVARYRSAEDAAVRWDALAYMTSYRFSLYSNFTFFSEDPRDGDMIHQRDQRTVSGGKVRYTRDDTLGSIGLGTSFGFELRHDDISNGLSRAPGREWGGSLVDARIDQTSAGLFVEEQVLWLPFLRTNLALRADGYLFAVDDRLEDRTGLGSRSSGERRATRLSPKASVMVSPWPWLDLFANFGDGFHSNDARGVVTGVTPVTRARSYELGLSARGFDRVRMRVALFRLDLDSELVWVGDAGTTEPRGKTTRGGLELDLQGTILPWLVADLSLALTRARFVDAPTGQSEVPLAPRRTLSARLTALHPAGYFGRLGLFSLGDRPATEDQFLVAKGFTRVDLSAGYRHERFELALALENLLNTRWRESQFANVSRLRGETSAAVCPQRSRAVSEGGAFLGCEDVHFTPGTPLAVRASASLFF